MRLVLFTLVGVFSNTCALRDSPITAGGPVQYLDGPQWSVSNADTTVVVGGSVPGDLLTDLQNAGVIPDPLHEQNFLPPVGAIPGPGAPYGRPVWDNQTWTYSTTFDLNWVAKDYADISLVFDGVKMAAAVSLNGQALGTVADMFYRYRYPVSSALFQVNNVLSLSFFLSNDTANNEGRWTSCSGGW